MKKITIFFIAVSFLFISCGQAAFGKPEVPHGYGTVIIGIAGNGVSRAVGENGLPVIKDSKMTIKVTKDDGVLIKEKDFSESETKSLSLTLPVGEKIVVKVIVKNVSARWSGEKRHEVTSGTNTVSVKLKKAAVALNDLLFGTNKPHGSHSGGVNDYTFTLKIGSKEVKKEHIKYHNFCRDNKAGIYLAYNTGNQWNIEHYTSEGDKEDKSFDGFMGVSPLILASDHATGAVYLVAKDGLNMKLYRINEAGGSPIELTGASLGYLTGYAVYNNVLIASGYGMVGPELKMYRITEDTVSEITLSAQPNLREDTKITLEVSAGWLHGTINDLYMTADTLYVLFSKYQTIPDSFSLGGIVKYSYTANGTTASISTPVRIGIANEHTSDGNGIYQTEGNNFYNPVKVVGFDEENLYIADDGTKFEYQKGMSRITANKNRIATLNKGTNALTFTDAPSGITWMGENPVWTGVSTKTIVWTKTPDPHSVGLSGVDYYQLNSAADALTAGAELAASDQNTNDNYFTDVFCFDEAGNLYIVGYSTGHFNIQHFELKDDGSYDTSAPVSTTLPDQPVDIAVDISGAVKNSAAQSVNALYYSYNGSDKSYIKRLTWAKNDPFFSAAEDNNFAVGGTLEGHQDPSPPTQKTRFTALAADKNGFFVALKETGTFGYTVRVQKYMHNDGSAVGNAINVLGEVTNASTWSRPGDLTALHIQEGILYGLTAVQYRYEHDDTYVYYPKDSISGKLMKIGSSTADFSGNAEVLYTTELPRSEIHASGSVADAKRKAGGKFAPYRFIAVMPKKLIIASDGFWGHITDRSDPNTDDVKQFNFIWDFGIKDDGSLEGTPQSTETDSAIGFSKTLTRRPYCGYEWK